MLPFVVVFAQPFVSHPVPTSLMFAGPSERPGVDVEDTVAEKRATTFVEHVAPPLPVPVRVALLPSCCEMLTSIVVRTFREHVTVPVTIAFPDCSSTRVCGSYVSVSVNGGGGGVKVADSCSVTGEPLRAATNM